MVVLMVLVLLLSITKGSDPTSGAIPCIAGTFKAGNRAFVICNFTTESDSGEIFVVHYQKGAPHTDRGDQVLVCFTKKNGEKTCKSERGYQCNNPQAVPLILEISEVDTRFAGDYSCFHNNSAAIGTISSKCSLQVEGKHHF
ncbi:hypothetical protein V1264_024695 [Littorina saxatilis]|uniref:Immunoglobulin subtype domain-containing protein n=1 Tax=Littorina saxatilis TaxID=31220 RepID=A0AAN9FYW3_9CAEN